MNRIRAFLALNFPVAATRRIAEEFERRRPSVNAAARVAWVPAANLHLTLKFLGSIPEESVEAIAVRLKRVAAGVQPFEARARGLGAFPSPAKARVLWIGVEAGEALARLQRETETAMVELGFAKEERAFHPHVTAARVPDPYDLSSVWSGEPDLGSGLLSEIVVYESRTLQKGAEYLARARVPLGKKET